MPAIPLRAATAALLMLVAGAAWGAVIAPELAAELAVRAPEDELAVIVSLADRVNPRVFEVTDRRQRDNRLLLALKAKAVASQGPLRTWAQVNHARRLRELWVVNAMALTVPASRVDSLARLAGVASVRPDSILQAPATITGDPAPPEWNLNAVRAPDLWAQGHTGSGIVVANMDTGVDLLHPDLAAKWRGGVNSWYDPHGQHTAPYDGDGHGTQTMGLMVGGSSGGTIIGVAPDARWIAARLYNDAGQASYSDIHLAFQWLLDPDGDPSTLDAPDVVNASWGLVGTAGQCITEFDDDIAVLKAAGTALAFAAGNDGPAPLTSLSPGNNVAGFAVGAVDTQLAIAAFSARGPSACDGRIYPDVTTPGVNVNTSDLSFGGLPLYRVVSGTSFAAPHTAGVLALLAGAFPAASVAELEAALTAGARDLGVAGADNAYGHGLADALAAHQRLLDAAPANAAPVITSVAPTGATEGTLFHYPVGASDPDGDTLAYSLDSAPAGMAIDAASGLIVWTPANGQAGAHGVTVRVADPGGLFATQSFTIVVAGLNHAPLAQDDVYRMIQRGTLSIAAPGMLANDSDPDTGDTLAAVNFGTLKPAGGTLVRNADGSFSFTPPLAFTGTKAFSYQAQDGQGALSNVATVSISVSANRPPLAVKDTASVPANRDAASYAPIVIAVLANDSDPDTAIDPGNVINPASVTISRLPNKGGSVTVNADGTLAYTPRLDFTGTETFAYRVKDTYVRPATSKAAYVAVSVQ